MKRVIVISSILLATALVCTFAIPPDKMATSDDHATAIAVMQARLEIIKSEIEISEITEKYYRELLARIKLLTEKGAEQEFTYLESRFNAEKSAAELKRNRARLSEVTALLEYAKTTGTIDPTLTIR